MKKYILININVYSPNGEFSKPIIMKVDKEFKENDLYLLGVQVTQSHSVGSFNKDFEHFIDEDGLGFDFDSITKMTEIEYRTIKSLCPFIAEHDYMKLRYHNHEVERYIQFYKDK